MLLVMPCSLFGSVRETCMINGQYVGALHSPGFKNSNAFTTASVAAAPSAITLTQIGTTAIAIEWTGSAGCTNPSGSTAFTPQWNLLYVGTTDKTPGAAVEGCTNLPHATTTCTATSLLMGNTYQFSIQDVCPQQAECSSPIVNTPSHLIPLAAVQAQQPGTPTVEACLLGRGCNPGGGLGLLQSMVLSWGLRQPCSGPDASGTNTPTPGGQCAFTSYQVTAYMTPDGSAAAPVVTALEATSCTAAQLGTVSQTSCTATVATTAQRYSTWSFTVQSMCSCTDKHSVVSASSFPHKLFKPAPPATNLILSEGPNLVNTVRLTWTAGPSACTGTGMSFQSWFVYKHTAPYGHISGCGGDTLMFRTNNTCVLTAPDIGTFKCIFSSVSSVE